MGIDRSNELAVGFHFSHNELAAAFEVTIPAKTHLEKRFSPTTGKEITSVVVVDQDETKYYQCTALGTKKYDELLELVIAIAKRARCVWYLHGVLMCGNGAYVFGINLPGSKPTDGELVTRSIKLSALIKRLDELPRIKAFLEKLGLTPGEPMISTLVTVS